MNEPVVDRFFGRAYPRSRREAHRRRATLISPPSVSLCVCIERPGNWRKTFKPFLRALLGQLNEGEPGSETHRESSQRIERFIESAFHHYDVTKADEQPDDSVELTHEFRDRRWERGLWRVEVLREYVALTLHVGIELGRNEDHFLVTLKGKADNARDGVFGQTDTVYPCPFLRAGPTNREAAEGLNTVLFNTLATDLKLRLDPLMKAVIPEFTKVPDDIKDKVFAVMYTATVPWTVLPDADPAPDLRPGMPLVEPLFPDFDEAGFAPGELSSAQQQTNRFLTQHWNVLKGSLISDNESDCVACYMLNGHCLYVSSLGSETANPNEPVKYLLMYKDPAGTPGADRGVSHAAPCNFAWRLSRFVGRVHDIGAARLRALLQHEEISRFLVHAKDIEFQLAERTLNETTLARIERRFAMITHARTRDVPAGEGFTDEDYAEAGIMPVTKPLMVRGGIVQTEYEIMRRLCADLEIIPLPAYQAYHHFLNRRVVGPIQWMLTAPGLHQSITQKLKVAQQARLTARIAEQSEAIRNFQWAADWVGRILIVYYVMQGAQYFARYNSNVKAKYHWPTWWPEADPDVTGMVGCLLAVAFVVLLWLTHRSGKHKS